MFWRGAPEGHHRCQRWPGRMPGGSARSARATSARWVTNPWYSPLPTASKLQMFIARISKFGYVIGVPEDSPIRSIAELKGKKIGVHSATGASALLASTSTLLASGLTPTDYELVTIGLNEQALRRTMPIRVRSRRWPCPCCGCQPCWPPRELRYPPPHPGERCQLRLCRRAVRDRRPGRRASRNWSSPCSCASFKYVLLSGRSPGGCGLRPPARIPFPAGHGAACLGGSGEFRRFHQGKGFHSRRFQNARRGPGWPR